jgi:Glycosyl hydrolase catalytic core
MGTGSRDKGGRAPRVAIVLAVLAWSLFATSAAQAVRSEFYGISSLTLDNGDKTGMGYAQVHTDRFPLLWSQVEPTKGHFNWSLADAEVGGLASRGIRPMPYIYASPPWVGQQNKPPIDTTGHRQGWATFLKAVVARYKAGGTYWTNPSLYHQQFGASATPWPIQSWQIWNEPTLDKFFHPGVAQSELAKKYGQLLQISNTPIRSTDSHAQIVLAGNPGAPRHGEPRAWDFLNSLYTQVSGVKNYFDVAAIHPYASTIDAVHGQVDKFRAVMKQHADGRSQLWITETGWGSAAPDSLGINKGLQGQAQYLTAEYKMLLKNRTAWNLQRVFWYLWRDPKPGSPTAEGCSFCGSAGLVTYQRNAKPSLSAFTAFTADSQKPVVTITGGPAAGSTTHDKTPTFFFKSSEAGSTFQCKFDAKPFLACASPYTPKTALTNGSHTFRVKAIDAAGNESAIKARSFKVG